MTTAITPTIATGTYTIDAATSSVTFEARHIFGLGPVQCSFAIRDGSIRIAADPGESTVDATVDAASFATNSAKRDKDVRSKRFLDAATYPDVTFAGTIRGTNADGGWNLVGNLRVRDITSPVAFRVTDVVPDGPGSASGFRATATARIDRFAAGVRARGPVAKYVDVRLAIVAVPAR
jgi:polyisoprenoid-binding protein YceI